MKFYEWYSTEGFVEDSPFYYILNIKSGESVFTKNGLEDKYFGFIYENESFSISYDFLHPSDTFYSNFKKTKIKTLNRKLIIYVFNSTTILQI